MTGKHTDRRGLWALGIRQWGREAGDLVRWSQPGYEMAVLQGYEHNNPHPHPTHPQV